MQSPFDHRTTLESLIVQLADGQLLWPYDSLPMFSSLWLYMCYKKTDIWPIECANNVENIWIDRYFVMIPIWDMWDCKLAEIQRVINCYYGRKTLYVSLSWVSDMLQLQLQNHQIKQHYKAPKQSIHEWGSIIAYHWMSSYWAKANMM